MDCLDSLRGPGSKSARTNFRARGLSINSHTNPWGYAERRWLWPGAAGWLANKLYDEFLLSGDLDHLRRRAFPFMKDASLFLLDLAVEGPDGKLVVTPSLSPEVGFQYPDGKTYRLCAGAAIDQQIAHDAFANTIEAARLLGTDAALGTELTNALARLAPQLTVGTNGALREWPGDWSAAEPQHRHVSHLLALYPGRAIDPAATPEWAAAAVRALELRGNNNTGWGAPRGAPRCGRACTGATPLTNASARFCAPAGPPPSSIAAAAGFTRTCSPRTRRSRLTRTSASRRRWRRCCFRAIVATGPRDSAWTSCPRYPPPGRKGKSPACAHAAAS